MRIPLSDKILLPYDSVESLPAHDRIDPSLKTGEICVTMVADTPVFVSDGDKNDPHFFRGSNGKYMIPGSTIRGMVRENMQILGFGLMRPGEDLEDIQIYFREIASASGSRDDPLKKYYCAALGIKQMPMPSGRPKAIPQLVKSGYLKKEKGKYKIYPSKGSYMLVRRDHPGVRCFGTEDARTENVYYRAEGDRVKEIRPAVGEKNGLRRGTLLYTGKPVRSWNRQTGRLEDHPNHLYLIPEADWSAQPLTLDEDDVLSYMEDFEKRRNVLGRNRNFWNLPLEGREKPVFYVQYMLLLSRVLSYVGVKTIGAVYSNYQKAEIEDLSRLIGFFDLVGGMQELTSFGSVKSLRAYYAETDDQKIEGLLSAMENLYETITLCKTKRIDGCMQAFDTALTEAETCEDMMMRQLLPAFRGKFGKKLTTPGLIKWCIQSDMYRYQAVGNSRLQMDSSTNFPILAAVNGYIEQGEEFRVFAVAADSEDGRRNCGVLQDELESLCREKNCPCPQIEVISAPSDERVASHVAVFQKLIDCVDDDDELFACITYGTKPLSQAVLLAVQYAYRVKKNASISCVVYGQIDRSKGKEPELWTAQIYDETALIQLGEIVRVLAERGTADPKAAINTILSM